MRHGLGMAAVPVLCHHLPRRHLPLHLQPITANKKLLCYCLCFTLYWNAASKHNIDFAWHDVSKEEQSIVCIWRVQSTAKKPNLTLKCRVGWPSGLGHYLINWKAGCSNSLQPNLLKAVSKFSAPTCLCIQIRANNNTESPVHWYNNSESMVYWYNNTESSLYWYNNRESLLYWYNNTESSVYWYNNTESLVYWK